MSELEIMVDKYIGQNYDESKDLLANIEEMIRATMREERRERGIWKNISPETLYSRMQKLEEIREHILANI